MNKLNVSIKINRILNGILILIFLLLIRVWYLSIYQHDEKEVAAEKPQKRISILKADRATIQDRFGVPLAINKAQYNVTLNYGEIQEIPRTGVKIDEMGKKVKVFKRKEYITALSHLLSQYVSLDPERIEDIIHARVSTLGRIPYVLKENITEEQYFRLKMLEKDWPGLHAEIVAKRVYPCGSTGCEVIGYLGSISRNEYDVITNEMQELQKFLAQAEEEAITALPAGYKTIDEVKERLAAIEKKAYTINDFVGKSGVEKAFDEKLRGMVGKKGFFADIKGNFLQELPGAVLPHPGNRLYLTLSKELQEYAESLLTDYENAPLSYSFFPEQGVWIKGGAIVALDPNTGEVLAMASYPRFDPNDFIRGKGGEENAKKNTQVLRWLEHESYIGSIWDGKEPMLRERFDISLGKFFEEKFEMNWINYLDTVLQEKSPVKQVFKKIKTIKDIVFIQNKTKELLGLFEAPFSAQKVFSVVYDESENQNLTLIEKEFLQKKMVEKHDEIENVKRELKPYFQTLSTTYDKILLVDLTTLVANASFFSPTLIEKMGDESILEYRNVISQLGPVHDGFKNLLKDLFHVSDFKRWKEGHFKDYLAEKRKEEKRQKKKFSRPFIEYLDEAEAALFKEFYSKYRLPLLTFFITGENVFEFLKSEEIDKYIHSLSALRNAILTGQSNLNWSQNFINVNTLLKDIEPTLCFAYLKTFRPFEDLTLPLLGKYPFLRDVKGKQLEKHLAAAFYPKYGYGYLRSRVFRQGATIGSIFKLIPAYEAMRQRYLMTGGSDLNPLTIIDDKHQVSKGEWNVGFTIDKKPIPLIYKGGRLPRSDHSAVGVVDVVKALEASSNPYFALLSGDVIEDPEDLCKAAKLFSFGEKTGIDLPGEVPGAIPKDVIYNRSGLYAMSIGQHSLSGTPLQIAVMLSAFANGGNVLKPKILYGQVEDNVFVKEPTVLKRQVFLPSNIRNVLLTGLRQVVQGDKGTARSLKKEFSSDLLNHIVGKTSTAEVVEAVSLDGKDGVVKCKDVWFGAIYFADFDYKKPEMVVVVYLRYGEYGWKSAPYAVKMIEKYLRIKNSASKN